ncbi:MAG: hypothetical protein V3V08_25370 [Nannocystaceae bacterium]
MRVSNNRSFGDACSAPLERSLLVQDEEAVLRLGAGAGWGMLRHVNRLATCIVIGFALGATQAASVSARSRQVPIHGIPECDKWAAGDGAEVAPRTCVSAITGAARNSLRVVDREESQIRSAEQAVETFTGGIGQDTQVQFEVGARWALRWVATGSFQIYVIDGAGKLLRTAAEQELSGTGSAEQTQGGMVRLEMNAGGPWEVQVIEYVDSFTYEYDLVGEIKVSNPYAFEIDVDLSIDGEPSRTERIPAGDYSIFSLPVKLGPYEERQPGPALLADFPDVRVTKVVNVSDAAAVARLKQEDQETQARVTAEEERERERERAADQFDDYRGEHIRAERMEADADARQVSEGAEVAKSGRRRQVLGGTLTALVGGGVSVALFAVGIPRRVQANDDVEKYEVVDPTFTERTSLGIARGERRAAGRLIGLGVATVGATVAVSSLLFWLARSETGNAAESAFLPVVGPGTIGVAGRF